MASVPKGKDLASVTLEDALKYLTLPRVLGTHPDTGEKITANVGMFGPYVVHQKDFRSLKAVDGDDVYTIELPRALEIFAQEKKKRGFAKKKK
jgi:DNA topoisomerase-1